jgi:hypothetical protein
MEAFDRFIALFKSLLHFNLQLSQLKTLSLIECQRYNLAKTKSKSVTDAHAAIPGA